MLTIEAMEQLGANTKEGVARCMGSADFYLRMVKLALADQGYENLKQAVEEGDAKAGFEAAHALKGVLANLAITPILTPVTEATEILRTGSLEGCAALAEQVLEEKEKFCALLG